MLWELVHVFFEHRGLLEGRTARRVHDAGASSFLYPFLAEPSTTSTRCSPTCALGADEGGRGRRAARRRRSASGGDALLRRRGRCAPRSTPAARCSRSATAARRPTRWTSSPTSAAPPAAAGRRGARIDLTEDPAILTAIANDIGTEAIFARQVIAYGRDGRRAARALDQRQLAQRDRARSPRRAGAGCATIALVGYDGGRVAAERLADHVVVTRSRAHPAHPGGAGQRLPRAARAGRSRVTARRDAPARRARVEGVVQGVGFRPVRLPAGRASSGSRATCCNDTRGVVVEVEGDPAAVERFLARLPAEAPPLARDRARARRRRSTPTGERGFAIRESPRGGEPRRARSRPTAATCDDCLARAVRPGRPPLPLPVRQLHQLRPAVHDRARRPLRPAAARRWPASRCAPRCRGRVRGPGRPPLPRPAERVPGLRAALCALGDAAARRRGRAPRRRCCAPARSSRSRASAATTWPAAPTTRRRGARCARASTARTSRSR